MTVISLRSGDVTARVSTFGGSVLRLDMGETPLLRPAVDEASPQNSACYPLVPFGNRIRGNRFTFEGRDYDLRPNTDWDAHYLHGEGWRSDWSVEEQSADTLSLSHRHDGSALPYHYLARQQIRLCPGGADFRMEVHNEGDRPMPFGIGWHPYFPMTPGTLLQTETGRMWTEEEGWLPGHPVTPPEDLDFRAPKPLPHHWVNNGFADWSGRATISWLDRGLKLHVAADPALNTMFLFVSDRAFDPSYQRDFFALEPMSHLADGHNMADLGGLVVLSPGESFGAGFTLRWERV